MRLSSAMLRSTRSHAATPARIAGLLLVGLAALCCLLELSSSQAGHHWTSEPHMAHVVGGGEVDPLAFTDSANAHDHTGANCPGEFRLILASVPPLHAVAADALASGPMPVTEADEGQPPQLTGTARSPASVPHLLCVMRT